MDDLAKKSVYSKELVFLTLTNRDDAVELGGGTPGLNPVNTTGHLF